MRFSEVIGQEGIGERLRNGVQSNRVAHAQLFDGPEGSGTVALALAYARYLHCNDRTDLDSCGECSSCRSYDSLQHPDLHWSFPFFKKNGGEHPTSLPFQSAWRLRMLAGPYFGQAEWLDAIGADKKQLFISVHEAMEINRKLGLKSFQGGWKVLICWLPETMRVDTANKMLKLIEEPTERTVMLFVSEHFDSLLATIRSRVQTIRVPRLSDGEATSALTERFDVEASMASQWAQVVDGNIAAALRLQQSEGSGTDHGLFVRWMRACYGQDSAVIVELAEEVSKLGREAMKRFFIYSMHMVRQCIVGNYGAMELVRLTAEERNFAEKFAPFIHHDNVIPLQALLEKAHGDVTGNVNGRLVFIDLSVQVNILLRKTT